MTSSIKLPYLKNAMSDFKFFCTKIEMKEQPFRKCQFAKKSILIFRDNWSLLMCWDTFHYHLGSDVKHSNDYSVFVLQLHLCCMCGSTTLQSAEGCRYGRSMANMWPHFQSASEVWFSTTSQYGSKFRYARWWLKWNGAPYWTWTC